jgi:hypothetical protein
MAHNEKTEKEVKADAEALYALLSKRVREKEQSVQKFVNKDKPLSAKMRNTLYLEYGHIQATHHKLEVLEFLLFRK